jgi:hypothetical protein
MNRNRKCIKCGTDFILELSVKSSNICIPCRREYQKKYENKHSKVSKDGKKDPYPIEDNARRRRFQVMQKELAGIKLRSEWIAYMKDKLDNLDPAILKWIYDRRDQDSLSDDRTRRNFKKDEYEDTRDRYNDKSWFD